FKADKFQKFLENDYDGVAEAIAGERGFISQLKQVLDGYATPGVGILTAREKGIQQRIRQIDQNIERKEMNLEKKTQALTDKFSRLQGALSGMQQQQQYLQATVGGGGNPIQQLLGG